MITKTALRPYVNPSVAFTFAAVSVTGLLMLFDLGDAEDLHKWAGIAFIIAGAMHVAIQWRVLVACFRGRKTAVWTAAIFLLGAILIVGTGDAGRDDGDDHKSEAMEYVKELMDE